MSGEVPKTATELALLEEQRQRFERSQEAFKALVAALEAAPEPPNDNQSWQSDFADAYLLWIKVRAAALAKAGKP